MIVLLLVIGLLTGTFAAVAGENEENLSQDTSFVDDEILGESIGDFFPCGGGSDGGGGGAPG